MNNLAARRRGAQYTASLPRGKACIAIAVLQNLSTHTCVLVSVDAPSGLCLVLPLCVCVPCLPRHDCGLPQAGVGVSVSANPCLRIQRAGAGLSCLLLSVPGIGSMRAPCRRPTRACFEESGGMVAMLVNPASGAVLIDHNHDAAHTTTYISRDGVAVQGHLLTHCPLPFSRVGCADVVRIYRHVAVMLPLCNSSHGPYERGPWHARTSKVGKHLVDAGARIVQHPTCATSSC